MSASWKIFETDGFAKDLREVERSGQTRIVSKLRETVYPELRQHPHFGPHIRKLKGYDPETWRYRIGVWRFFYEIDDAERTVLMLAAVHRGSAY